MLKSKKLIAMYIVIIYAAFICITSVAADFDFSYVVNNNNVTLEFDIRISGYGTMIYVFDTPVNSTEELTEEFIKSHLVYATVADSNTVSFNLPQNISKCKYYVVFGNLSLQEQDNQRIKCFNYISEQTKQDVISLLQNAQNGDEVLNAIKELNGFLYDENFELLENNKTTLLSVSQKININELEDIKSIIDGTKAAIYIKTSDVEQTTYILKNNSELFRLNEDFSNNPEYVAYEFVNLRKSGQDVNTVDGIANTAYIATALSSVNNATRENIIDEIQKYNDLFKVDFQGKYTSVSKYDLSKKLKENTYVNINDVALEFNQAVNNLYKENSGGSGGSGRGSSINTLPLNGSVVTSDTVEDLNSNNKEFTDIDAVPWAKDAIEYLSYKNIMVGNGGGEFLPDQYIKREEFVKIIISAFNAKESSQKVKFDDVQDTDWFTGYIASAIEHEIINGITETEFGVGQNVSRQDAAVMICRAAKAFYHEFDKKQTIVDFNDYEDVSEYAKVSVDVLSRAQIISGFEDGTFKPNGNITRAQAAKMIFGITSSLK